VSSPSIFKNGAHLQLHGGTREGLPGSFSLRWKRRDPGAVSPYPLGSKRLVHRKTFLKSVAVHPSIATV
jgi:hypothetical protein